MRLQRRRPENGVTRDRIDCLDLARRRFQRRVWLAVGIQTIVLGAAIGIGHRENSERTREIQAQRRAAIIDACQRDLQQNHGIIAYLSALGADAQELEQARQFFPDDLDCQSRQLTEAGGE